MSIHRGAQRPAPAQPRLREAALSARLAVFVPIALMLANACDSGSAPTQTARPSPSISPAPVAAPGVSAGTVTFSLTEFSITPAVLSLPSNHKFMFVARNDGTVPHSLSIFGKNVHLATDLSAPGESHAVSASLPTGTYRFICPVRNHAQLGMTTIVTVTP
jgi:hypothetical protein